MANSSQNWSPASPFASFSWKLDEARQPDSHSLHQYNGNYNDILDLVRTERAQRDFLDFDGPQDRSNPFNWPTSKKWRVTLLACFMTLVVQLNGTEMTSAAEQINESFRVSDEHFPHSYWPVLSWNLGGAAAPMLALPLMEHFGVRWSYFVSTRCVDHEYLPGC
jgi:hypothetical protein